MFHALQNCAFYVRTHKFMVECFGEWRVNGKTGRWMHFPLEHTFNTTPGLVLWTARKAHWATRCSAAPSNEPTFEQYVQRWLQELKTLLVWQPLKAHHAGIQKFFNSLMHFIQRVRSGQYTSIGAPDRCTMCNHRCTITPSSRNVMNAKQPWRNKSWPYNKSTSLKDGTFFISMGQPSITPKPDGWGDLAVATRGTGSSHPPWTHLKSKQTTEQS